MRHDNPSLPTFRVDGHLFRVTPDGILQYYQGDFDTATGLGEVAGLWKSIKKICKKIVKGVKKVAKVALPVAAVAVGVNVFSGGKYLPQITGAINTAKGYLPSADTVAKAATAGVAILTATANAKQQALMQAQSGGAFVDPTQMTPDMQAQFAQPTTDTGYRTTIDPKLLMLGGAGLLVVLMMLKKG